jgi:hypothetical protein
MTGWTILALIVLFVVACAAIGYATFVAGFNLGWQERHSSMVLPEHVLQRIDGTRWRT